MYQKTAEIRKSGRWWIGAVGRKIRLYSLRILICASNKSNCVYLLNLWFSGHIPTMNNKFGAARIPRDQVIRVEKSSQLKSIEVKTGLVWLTGTPARGDVVLAPGERFVFDGDWPFVVQALEGSELFLRPTEEGREEIGLPLMAGRRGPDLSPPDSAGFRHESACF